MNQSKKSVLAVICTIVIAIGVVAGVFIVGRISPRFEDPVTEEPETVNYEHFSSFVESNKFTLEITSETETCILEDTNLILIPTTEETTTIQKIVTTQYVPQTTAQTKAATQSNVYYAPKPVETTTAETTIVETTTVPPETTVETTTVAETTTIATVNNNYLGYFKITGYTDEEGFKYGQITASGHPCEEGICAMNNSQRKSLGIKYGDAIYIEGYGTYYVYDCGCSWGTIDIWCWTNKQAYGLTGHADAYRK